MPIPLFLILSLVITYFGITDYRNKEAEYQECKTEMDSQNGIIAVLPKKCMKHIDRLIDNP